MTRPLPRLATALVLAATLLGCGAQPSASTPAASTPAASTSTATGFPVSVPTDRGTVQVEAEPQQIVSLSPTGTEMLFAVGAGDQVAAVDDNSDYPAQAPTTTTISSFDPDVESVLAQEPDLVVVSDDINDVVAGLQSAGVTVLLLGAAQDLGDTYDQLKALGAATGHPEESAAVVADMQQRIAAVPALPEGLTYYHELDPSLFTATSQTFIGELYAQLGLTNIADAADADGSGYPQISAELLVTADPDLVFLADTVCCGQSAATYAERPGLGGSTAVRTGGVIGLDDSVASRWGPRVVELLERVSAAVADRSLT